MFCKGPHAMLTKTLVCGSQEQEDPNKLATSWPDYYIDRINSMAAVSDSLSPALSPVCLSRMV